MISITDAQITTYVAANIGDFHDKRLERLNNLTLEKLLLKNPYLFKSKNLITVSDLVKSLLDAYLSSQEETLFGKFLEGLARFVALETLDVFPDQHPGIDLEFVKDDSYYIVQIKSGPNWGNKDQLAELRQNFEYAALQVAERNPGMDIVTVNGCCYGRDTRPQKRGYIKICGQEFWELISNDDELYTRIIEPIGHDAKRRSEQFEVDYVAVINRFSLEFSLNFCDEASLIDWPKLVRYTSAKGRKPQLIKPNREV